MRCGNCGTKLYTTSHHERRQRRYLCRSGVDFGGCGRLSVRAPDLEELVYRSVLQRLDTPHLAATLAGRHRATETTAALSEEIAADASQLDELAAMWGAREISAAEWRIARAGIESRLISNRLRQAQLSGTTALDGLVGNSDRLRDQWDTLNLNRQRAIVAAVIDHVVVHKSSLPQGSQRFDPSRVVPVWRL